MADGFTDSIQITMEPGGIALFRGFEKWADLVKDPMRQIGPYATTLIHRHHARTFASEGSGTGDGKRWAPLSARYAAEKSRAYPGRPLLVRTSVLRSALTGGGRGSRVRTTKTTLEVGVKGKPAEYARYHQEGTPIMPARPPVKFDRRIRPGTLPFVLSQMIQRVVVDYRKAALGVNAGVTDAKVAERRTGSLQKLSKERTR
jgi:hypothetical protein